MFPTSISSSRWTLVPLFNMLGLLADRTAVHKLLFPQHGHSKRHFNGGIGKSTHHCHRTREHSTANLNNNHEPRAGDDTSGSASQDCTTKPPPQQQHLDSLGSNTNVRLVGGGAFWIYDGFYQNVLHLSQFGPDQRWPMTKWVVEVGPNTSLPVTLRLRDRQTKTLAWWTDGQTPPEQPLRR
ncbi:hypothetical protein [Ktedonobacter sp. SOSP1-52]|uniref:hypothetical protein n=1 Tax=Ktedonobacter sp. SOSP1-52 TaxID=2778366 RepID=UPI001916AC12|nr:hypothetical protein [Ktedonobacter sp. SOSP1-52]